MSSQPPLTRDGTPRAFFGRKSGKRLHVRQKHLFETLLPELQFDLEAAKAGPKALFAAPVENCFIEIGYGGGEHLSRMASQNPRAGFIGCEVFTGGIGKLLEKIGDDELGNIRLYTEDALNLLNVLPDRCLDGAFLLYPDPWPKKRHHKRRFVSQATLDALGRVLRPGGFFKVATDIEDYANWTMAHVLRHADFVWPDEPAGSWHTPFDGWQATRYEQKARREGRMHSFYFTFERKT